MLVGLPLAIVLVTLLLRARRREQRTLYAALFAAAAIWVLHAGIDWDWQMPAVTLWLFALGGGVVAGRRPAMEVEADRTPLAARFLVAAACVAIASFPVRLAFADGPLGKAVLAYQDGDCARAAERARDAADAEADTAQAYEVEGLCAARGGRPTQAQQLLREAVSREPANWHFHYSLALAEAAGGTDPRGEALAARTLNPLGPVAQIAVRVFATSRPPLWRRRALPLLRDAGLAQTR